MAGNWTTDKTTEYRNVRAVGDAKFFPASGEGETRKGAATFFPIVDGTKNGEDIFVDVKALRGADKLATLKKGDEVSVRGTVEFSLDRNGKLRGKIWDATVSLTTATREALKARAAAEAESAAQAAAEPPPADVPADDTEAPAFG